MSIIRNSGLTIRSETIGGYINTRGTSGILSLSQQENDPDVYIGNNAGAYNSGTGSTFVGINSGYNNNGSLDVAVGYESGYSNTGTFNTFLGFNAGRNNTGSYNTSIGYNAGANRNGEASVLVGANSGIRSSSYGLVSIGVDSGMDDRSVDGRNVFIGTRAGKSNVSGVSNTFIGGDAGKNNFSGGGNTFIGTDSSINNVSGSGNICVGVSSNTTDVLNGILIGNSSNVTVSGGIAIGHSLTANQAGLFINPVRSSTSLTNRALIYNTSTSEINYSTTKTFIIDHPIDSSKYLVHACLEGPESGVYYRGKGEILENDICKVELPLYVRFAYDFTVNVTPIGTPRTMSCSEVVKPESPTEPVYFYVFGTGKFYWILHGKRGDIEPEIEKETISINGEGPYKWIESNTVDNENV